MEHRDGQHHQMLTEKSNAPRRHLFGEVPLCERLSPRLRHFSSIKRVRADARPAAPAGAQVDIVQRYHHRMANLKRSAPRSSRWTGCCRTCSKATRSDVLKFPVPLHHEQDKSGYIAPPVAS